MPHRERKHRLLILDFQQQRIATGAEANHQFTLERFVLANFTTAQRCHFKYGDSITRELQSALGHSKISPSPLQQIAVEPRKIITRLLGKTDVEAHPGSALARLVQLGLQPGQHILHVDVVACRLGAVTRGQPACDEGFLLLALLHLGADGVLDKAGQRLALLQHGFGRFAQRRVYPERWKRCGFHGRPSALQLRCIIASGWWCFKVFFADLSPRCRSYADAMVRRR
ncbi:hypothetical protein XAC2852_240012 [Xanthomonas citri pv. citri]|nr:hypothetical protein XAC2852_240012 [Xanthomonas citri pv. citri]